MTEQAVFDFTSSRATIRFTPPTWSERATSQLWAGVRARADRPVSGVVPGGAGAGGQAAARAGLAGAVVRRRGIALGGHLAGISWAPPPRFVEAAAALTVAYLAIEILVLPTPLTAGSSRP